MKNKKKLPQEIHVTRVGSLNQGPATASAFDSATATCDILLAAMVLVSAVALATIIDLKI